MAAADVLRAAFRERDVVARLGGDEFVAMALLGRRDDERLDRQAIETRLDDAVRAKRAELGDDYDFSVSFGSMVANHVELDEIDELLARADQRMYRVKRARRRELDSWSAESRGTRASARSAPGPAGGEVSLPSASTEPGGPAQPRRLPAGSSPGTSAEVAAPRLPRSR